MHNLNFIDNLILGSIVIFYFTGLIISIQHEIFCSSLVFLLILINK